MKCKICNTETDLLFEINRVDQPVCDHCSKRIFFIIAGAVAKNQTVFDIGSKKERKPVSRHPEITADVLNYLYKDLLKGKRYTYTADNVPSGFLDVISSRVNEGHTVEEMKAVAHYKYKEWGGDKNMRKFLRANTLYGNKFDGYLAEIAHERPKWNVVNNATQRQIIKELNSYGVRGEINDTTDALAKQLMATGYSRKDFLNLYLKQKI